VTADFDPSMTLQELRALAQTQAGELATIRRELIETNNGVLALYAELDDRAELLRQATELKSRFLSYMSHEFRTPLSAIASLSRILLDRMDGPLNVEQEKQVLFIHTAVDELTEMVNDLLDLAKLDAGRISVSPDWFDMVDLFSALRGMFKPILQAHAVDLVFEAPQEVPRLYTDHKKLSQILRNYISNAIKFTPAGQVRVSASRVEEDRVRFTVADTGIGIAPEHLGELFHDFAQIDSRLQKRLRGTGLGLALCKRLAALLGGEVHVESSLGVGSRFSVTIPRCMPAQSAPDAPTGGDAA